jgi:hypothetical protein
MNRCKYKHVFGEPRKGVHSYRVAGVAAVDVLGTMAVAMLISFVFSWSFWTVLPATLVLGIVLHRLMCVDTAVDRLLFGA